ncbi:helix-turn-helix transcriptional regulator [Gloeocapsopsis crepidinum LEGE 06123]|uniref:Helix-turn-helix transcriptional regulator n=1 Tax=Gloeocapsopsis crepidinum LEGE 06123 TaxID=588587 RepID=A0ABR9UVT2_9CHRO|nr:MULTISPECIES: helix-turn-helix transcriptional regulator [Chroococcaceae]AFZ31654.1 helix-turn-helix domain protein [Gloeocapsa sp. PCC 7428]MBE9191423.1 helix-turn-helix transcriptional regulator [Gloeocapsopsis crepidinum LEGE 06123]
MQESDQEGDLTLKLLRERTGLSQEKLGRRLDLSLRTVGDWETGKKIPRFDNAIALARELGVSLKTLAKAMKLDVEGVPDDESD